MTRRERSPGLERTRLSRGPGAAYGDSPPNMSTDFTMNKKLQVVIVFAVGLVAMVVGYAVLKGM